MEIQNGRFSYEGSLLADIEVLEVEDTLTQDRVYHFSVIEVRKGRDPFFNEGIYTLPFLNRKRIKLPLLD